MKIDVFLGIDGSVYVVYDGGDAGITWCSLDGDCLDVDVVPANAVRLVPEGAR